jgi:hypothetical protein
MMGYLDTNKEFLRKRKNLTMGAALKRAREIGEMRTELMNRGFKNHDIRWLFTGMKVLYDASYEFNDTTEWEILSKNESDGWVIIRNYNNLPVKVEDLKRIKILYS